MERISVRVRVLIYPLKNLKSTQMEDIQFENFKDNFLYQFVFTAIERPHFTEFLNVHFLVYKMLYKDFKTVEEYAIIAFNDELKDCQSFGMTLKK